MKRLACFLCIVICLQLLGGSAMTVTASQSLRESFVRLHIRAESDSEEDQAVKLKVRDAVLTATEALLGQCESASQAGQLITENLELFRETARETLRKEHAEYDVQVSFGDTYFPVRNYGEATLPAGTYHSLIITLGSGRGHNWWCVMFPPLCYAGEEASELDETLRENLSEEDYEAVTGKGGTVVRFKVWDALCDLYKRLTANA